MVARRILMITALDVWALAGGGGAASLYQTLAGFGRRGHTIDVVGPTIGANHHFGVPALPPPAIEGVRFHSFRLPSLSDAPVALPPALTKVDQKLRFALLFPVLASRLAGHLLGSAAYDLLYGYEVHGVLAQRLVRRRQRLPLVARFQGTVMHPYLDRPLSRLRKYEEVLALGAAADLYVMTDDGTRGDEVLARLNPRARDRTRFWRNGLDLEAIRAPTAQEARAARCALGLKPADFVLLTTARLARWKRTDRAIDALAALRARGVDARLIVVGDGEERAALEAQARRLALTEAVDFRGAVPQGEVRRYLWAADVFLSLSELSNVGNPLLEAMVTRRCILTLDEGDTRDLIQDGANGVLLASDAGPPASAAALAALAADAARRRRLATAARKYAASHFWSWQERIDAEVDAVEALLEPGSRRAHGGG